MKALRFSRQALKCLQSVPTNTSRLIRSKIAQYAAEPASLGNNVKALKGSAGVFQLRVGDWRVIFTEAGDVIDIVKIAHRSAVYE